MESMGSNADVYLEVGSSRVFAGAIDWPGWCRSGRDEAGALDALAGHGPRYAAALAAAGVQFALFVQPGAGSLRVVERLRGGSGTDFGVPSATPSADDAPLDEGELVRQAAILRAAWAAFDDAARRHAADRLRKGPRGGGRDLGKIVAHVREADEAYLVQLGARPSKAGTDPADMTGLRESALAALSARTLGLPVERPSRATRLWLPRYFVRRAAWHALDHAWEIEDRAIPPDQRSGV